MNIRHIPSFSSEETSTLNATPTEMPISEVLRLLEGVRNGPMDTRLLAELKTLEAKLLQMEGVGIQSVSGALRVMLTDLQTRQHIAMSTATDALTTSLAANDEFFARNDSTHTF